MVSLQENLSFLNAPSLPSVDNFISLLRTCKTQQNLALTKLAHLHACSYGIDAHGVVGNHLVPTFVGCGGLLSAQQAFDRLTDVNEFSFQSLIEAYMESGKSRHGMLLFHHMQEQSIPFSKTSYILLLNASARLSCLEFGKLIHERIKAHGLQEDIHVSNAIVSLYAKCGSLPEAVEVFDRMTARDAATWTSLISGFAKHGKGEKVLNYLQQMELAGMPPDPVTLVCGVKACACIGSLHMGHGFHLDIIKKGLEDDSFIGNSLIDMYSKCHSIVEAEEVLSGLPVQTSVTWNALISGYIDNHLHKEALTCFHNMQKMGFCPDTTTYRCVLKACGTFATILEGHQIHAEISLKGWEENVFVGTALVDMYAKCGYLNDAYAAFTSLPTQNTVTWNALIAGYAEQGLCEEVLGCVKKMHLAGVSCDTITYTSCLKAASVAKDINLVEEIHAIIEAEIYIRDPFVGGTLVDTYVKCGSVSRAQEVFNMLPVRDIISWTTLMSGYVEHGSGEKALTCFHHMQIEGVVPNRITYLCMLKASGSIGGMDACQRAHSEILKKGYDEGDILIGNSLVDMYINCDSLAEALEIFNRLPSKSVVSWNILISGYVESGYCVEALELIEQMQHEGVLCDAVTFYSSLNACNGLGEPYKGLYIHAEIAKEGLQDELFIGSSLVHMYTKYGLLTEAKEVFDSLLAKDVVVWTALIAGFAEKGFGEEAWSLFQSMKGDGVAPDAVFWNAVIVGFAAEGDFEKSMLCFIQMQEQGVLPDYVICSSILEACGNAASLGFGKRFHALVQKPSLEGMQEGFLVSLIELYCKCGHSFYAKTLFDEIGTQGLASWNALLAGFAHHGQCEHVFDLFRRGSQEWHPDERTFLGVLNASCHGGLLVEGLDCFEAMSKVSGLCLTYEHCNCIIDLLARAGQEMEAFTLVERLPFQPDIVTWTIVLGACQKWGNILLGREAFYRAMRLKNNHAGTFIMMSNIYTDYGIWEMAQK